MPIKTLEKIFTLADREQANRITITKQENDFSCCFELPDKEETYFKLPKKLESDLIENLRKLLKIAPDDLTRGKYCKLRSSKFNLNFRVSIIPDKFGEKIVISLIKDKSSLFRLNQLGLQPKEKQLLEAGLKHKSGLILITSPEHGGRSTTLFSCLNSINRDDKSVYFMGLYPEFDLKGILSLKNNPTNWEIALHHDSDIIAIDDCRDEDLEQAFIAADTGRLVIATLPAINCLEALYKLLKLNLPLNLLLDNLKLITAQSLTNLKRNTSNKGRKQIGLFEVLKPNKELINYLKDHQARINTKTFWEDVLQLAKRNDYSPLINDAKLKEKAGII
ncbi:MAG: protein transport protein HofB [Patescibacteria group bacterium]|nr:protein transport protein HofB [Patescibacteria group bacterium]